MTWPNTALIVVDVQNDFCPGGALGMPEGDKVAAVANALIPSFPLVVLTQDWHPPDHKSFASNNDGAEPYSNNEMPYGNQVMWPDHCIQRTAGAAFHSSLEVEKAHMIIRKGFRPSIDSYSTFFENDRTTSTGLDGYLKDQGVDHVVLAGLATDYCVYYSAIDARKLGYKTTVIEDGCRGIDLDGSLDAAMTDMRNNGVVFKNSNDMMHR
jgi:nicotinamidase/pyrazinamidase